MARCCPAPRSSPADQPSRPAAGLGAAAGAAATAVSPPPLANGQQGHGNGRPVTRHDTAPAPTTNGNGRAGQLVYGDGTAVDPGNQKEAATYRRYLAAKQAAPASKAALLAYYREAVG
jgi:hypothetical protein